MSCPLMALIPYFLCCGKSLCRAIIRAYILGTLSPFSNPIISLIFFETLVLHEYEHRRYLVGEHVGVCCCCQPFSSQGSNIQTTGQLVEKSWMSCFYLVLQG